MLYVPDCLEFCLLTPGRSVPLDMISFLESE